jgi:hypothetical protein
MNRSRSIQKKRNMIGGINTRTSSVSISENIGKIKSSVESIRDDLKEDVKEVTGKVLNVLENPEENIQKLIKALLRAPIVLEQIIVDPEFIKQVKIVSLTLAQAISDSVEIMTPYMLESYSTLVEKLARNGFLAILDAAGVVPVVGEVIDGILIIHDLVMSALNVAHTSIQVSDISSLLLNNMIRIYKQNAKQVDAAHGRITTSTDDFQNTNTSTTSETQKGGKKKSKSTTRHIRNVLKRR